MNLIENEIHAEAREATARQVYKALAKQDCPDLAIAIVLMAIDDWYSKGLKHGAGQIILPPLMSQMTETKLKEANCGKK